MKIKGIVHEDFVNYKKPSMFISTATCSFKCDKESGVKCCQNSSLAAQPNLDVEISEIIDSYMKNPITKAIVLGGLEPMDQFADVAALIGTLRYAGSRDDVVIYTGYKPDEISYKLSVLEQWPNIIVKFGRFIPNSESRYDDVLGVTLASKNQYAEKIS
jgi:organic radical activating enzyme